MLHAVPHRYYRAWKRTCTSCNYRHTSDLNLTITIKCPYCSEPMSQAPQGSEPDIETVTEWLTCDPTNPNQWRCAEHREA